MATSRFDTAWVHARSVALAALVAVAALVASALLPAGLPGAPGQVLAQELPLAFQWQIAGNEVILVIEADDEVEDAGIELRVGRGRATRFERAFLAAGSRWEERIPAPNTTTTYQVRIDGVFAGERGSLTHSFEVPVYASLDFDVDETQWDPAVNRMVISMNQPADRVELEVRGEDGGILAERIIRFNGEAPGTPLEVTWTARTGRVLTIDIKAYSRTGAWMSRQYIPWAVEFDAVHVNFASGSADIPESDFAMLEGRLAEVRATADRVRAFVQVQLYVAGYTDTVGGGPANQTLSEARARSLGAFFRARGFTDPVFFQGFGEDGQAVPTADNVDEPANRRAIFILSTRAPGVSADLPRGSWRSL